MKKSCLLIALLFIVQYAFAQNGIINMSAHCPNMKYCADCGDAKATFPGKLTKYVEKEIDWMHLSKIHGVILVQLGVDSVGNVCTRRVINRTTVGDDVLEMMKLEKIFDPMPRWQPAIVDGQQVASAVMIAIYCRVQKHNMFEVGYLRDDKEKKWTVKNASQILMYYDDKAAIPD